MEQQQHHHHHHHHHMNPQQSADSNHAVKPVTIVGGFLGSGKTTFVNYILAQSTDKKIDVLVREYGTVSIDDKLLNLTKDHIHVFPGVSMHQDPQIMLYDYMQQLYESSGGEAFDRLLIETSGLDNPEYLIQLFFLGYIPSFYRLGSFITVVDAEYGHLDMNEYLVARQQVAFADVILLNKIDLPDKDTVQSLERRIKRINSMAKIFHTSYGRVELSDVLDVSLYDQLKGLQNNLWEGDDDYCMDGITTLVLTENHPMDKEKVNAWIQNLFVTRGTKILRSKGFFCFAGSDYRYEFQAVRKTFHSKADRIWEDNEERKSVVVLIGESLPDVAELQESFSACL